MFLFNVAKFGGFLPQENKNIKQEFHDVKLGPYMNVIRLFTAKPLVISYCTINTHLRVRRVWHMNL